ncbi:MAG TPA: hypothetical protein VLJ83_08775 [Gemmatimonadaceae bacterium]|nr:hypothetical protein [Gemmatimonadaceae bacterium]
MLNLDRIRTMRLRDTLGLAANVTTIVAGIIASLFLTERMGVDRERATPAPLYDVAEELPEELPFDVHNGEQVVLLSVRSTCVFCTQSMPFYRQLQRDRGASTKLMVVGDESVEKLTEYAARNGLKPDSIATIRPKLLRTSVTPFLVIADSQKRVVGSWVGMLTEHGQKEVIQIARQSVAEPGS